MKFLETFKSDKYADVSFNQWMALTPKSLIRSHTGLKEEHIRKLKKEKHAVV
jgi:oxalate decarboxylase